MTDHDECPECSSYLDHPDAYFKPAASDDQPPCPEHAGRMPCADHWPCDGCGCLGHRASDDLFTDDERRKIADILGDTRSSSYPWAIDQIEAAVAPSIAARAVQHLMDELMDMDAAGAFGECCANPDCRACTVLQLIAQVASLEPEDEP